MRTGRSGYVSEMSDRSMRERMLAGELYLADDPVLSEESQRAQRLTHRINTMDPNDHAREKFGALIFGYPGDPPPPDKRKSLCLYVLTEGTKGNVPVEQINRASRLCAR